jgi:hypothetical protein
MIAMTLEQTPELLSQAIKNVAPIIRALRAEAGNAGDTATVEDCTAALDGDTDALIRVTRIVLDAAAMGDE